MSMPLPDSLRPARLRLVEAVLLGMLLAPWTARADAGDDPAAIFSGDDRPVRARRPFFVASELSWNGLGGLGLLVG